MGKIVLFIVIFIAAFFGTLMMVGYIYLSKGKKQAELLMEMIRTSKAGEKELLDQLSEILTSHDLKIPDGTIPDSDSLKPFADTMTSSEKNTYIPLVNQLEHIQEDLSQQKKQYNQVAQLYNIRSGIFPINFVAVVFHYPKLELFS